jgi:putative N-acetylmannosamine-6-phosphate epimerase
MQLNKGVIINVKTMNENELFVCTRDMKNMVQMNASGGKRNIRFTDVYNIHKISSPLAARI